MPLSRRRLLALAAAGATSAMCAACSAPAPTGPPPWASRARPYAAARSLYGLTDANLARWRAARDAGRAHVTTMLDSITHGAGVLGITRPAAENCWPGRLRRALDARAGASGSGVVVPWNTLTPASDDRWRVTGAVTEAGLGVHACACLRIPGGPADADHVEFTAVCDTFVVHHLGVGAGARFTVDGVPVLATDRRTVSTGPASPGYGSPGSGSPVYGSPVYGGPAVYGPLVSTVPAGALGEHTLRVLSPGREPTATAALLGVEACVSEGGIRVSNLARTGLSTGALAVEDPSGLRGLAISVDAMRADLAILLVGANDFRGHVPLDVFTDRVLRTVRRQRAYGDVLLATPGEPDPAIFPPDHVLDPPLSAYHAALYRIADSEGLPLLDIAARWGSHDRAQDDGFFDDGIHPNDAGSEDIARAVADVLLA